MRHTLSMLAAVVAVAIVADVSFAQVRRTVVVPARPVTVNPYNYPLATPSQVWQQAAWTQWNAQQAANNFQSTVYQMAYPQYNYGYNPYAYGSYGYNPYSYSPYGYTNPYATPYVTPYYRGY